MRYDSPVLLVLLSALVGSLLVLTGCDAVDTATEVTNEAPTAEATVASSQPFNVNDPVQLDGSGSSDPDNDELNYEWTLDTPSGSNASLEGPNTVDPTFIPDVGGTYTASLEVSDGEDTDTDDVTVMAEGNVIGSNITSDQTLSSDLDHLVTGDICVEQSATLTIEAGTQIMFEANTSLQVCEDASALVAEGTESDPITLTGVQQQDGFWRGVAFYSNNQKNKMSYVEVTHGGGGTWSISGTDRGASVVLESGSRLSLSNSTIRNSGSYGLYGNGGTNLSGFASNTFENNAEAPVLISAKAAGFIDGNSSFASGSYVGVYAQDITSDLTLTPLANDVPYRFSGTTEVKNGAQLSIDAGVEMEFASGAGLSVNDDASSLVAEGTSSEGIVMMGAQQQDGFWQGVAFDSDNQQNEMSYVEVAYAGGGTWSISGPDEAASVMLESGSRLSLSNSTIRNSGSYGLYGNGGTNLSGFASNTFENNVDAPVLISAKAAGFIDGNSSFAGDSYVGVYAADVTSDLSLTPLANDVPYRFSGTTEVKNGAQLNIDAGVEMEFASEAGLSVNDNASSLVAEGTSSEGIVMTGAQQQAGFWQGVAIYSSNQQNVMDYVTVEYGGSNTRSISGSDKGGNVVLEDGSQLALTNSSITDSERWGVWLNGNSVTFDDTGTTYQNNSSGDVGQP